MFSRNEKLQGKEYQLLRLEANNPRQTTATFDTFPMFDEDIKRLILIIQKNTHLTQLSLFDSRIPRELMEPLVNAVLDNEHLISFNFDRFQDYPPNIQELFEKMDAHLKNNQSSLSPSNSGK